jgi:hypothetical protein
MAADPLPALATTKNARPPALSDIAKPGHRLLFQSSRGEHDRCGCLIDTAAAFTVDDRRLEPSMQICAQ